MRKIMTLAIFAFLTLALASCNWNPTDLDTGGGRGDGDKKERDDKKDDKKERDGMLVRGMEGDAFKTPCDFHFVVQSIQVQNSTTDRASDSRQVIVVIEVVSADGTTTAYTLTKENPSVTIGDCTIHLKGVDPIKSRDSDRVNYVASFAITSI